MLTLILFLEALYRILLCFLLHGSGIGLLNYREGGKEDMSDLFSAGGVTISLYSTPDSMRRKVDEYFDMCFATKYNKVLGRDIRVTVQTPTYAGLARYLGFSTRAQMLEYANKRDEAYSQVIADAKLRIEDYLEGELVHSKAPNGIMFSLKNNAGWEEKTKQQITGSDGAPLVFGWATNAGDVIETKATGGEKEGVLPSPPPQIESTCK